MAFEFKHGVNIVERLVHSWGFGRPGQLVEEGCYQCFQYEGSQLVSVRLSQTKYRSSVRQTLYRSQIALAHGTCG